MLSIHQCITSCAVRRTFNSPYFCVFFCHLAALASFHLRHTDDINRASKFNALTTKCTWLRRRNLEPFSSILFPERTIKRSNYVESGRKKHSKMRPVITSFHEATFYLVFRKIGNFMVCLTTTNFGKIRCLISWIFFTRSAVNP